MFFAFFRSLKGSGRLNNNTTNTILIKHIMVLSQGQKVFLGTAGGLAFCYVTFFAFQNKKSGHNLFDVNK